MNDTTDRNPLIADDQPANTLNQCAAALEWMSSVSEDTESMPNDDEIFGRYMLEKCIVQALRYEAGRITGPQGNSGQRPAA